ncbi:hypothetical protein IEQ34_000894 [Dendrobium chrysotoxum]|uniref:DUF7610 domain-containing protein n=1 Tax=Dendrobium chrysotoxum TaxID=161865 RepID=A0AAV7HJX1_DENCH|nr:hypothetical protein IEQ34_000894 [Dendrobium chrysotoxum]
MESIEVLLTKKLDDLESEVYFLENPKELHYHQHRAAALHSKLSFLKSLFAAENGGTSVAGRLGHIAARVSALESIFSGADDAKIETFRLRLAILHKNIQELESMAKEPVSHQSAAKILSKIDFTKSLLAVEAQSEDLSSLGARLVAVEKAFGDLTADNDTQPSCSSASCHTEEMGPEDVVASSLRNIEEVEKESNGDDYDDVKRKIGFLKSLFSSKMNWKREEKKVELNGFVTSFSSIGSEFADRSRVSDDAIGGNVSYSCSCTSSCFDGGEEKEKQEEEEKSVYGVNETGEVCPTETTEMMEGKSETADSEKGSLEMRVDGERRFGKLRTKGAMLGVFAVAAVGFVVGSFLSAKEKAYLVPT